MFSNFNFEQIPLMAYFISVMILYRCIGVIVVVFFCSASCTVCKVDPKYMYSTIGSTVNLTCNVYVERKYLTWLGPPNLTTYAIGNATGEIQDSIRIIGNESRAQHILQIVKMQDKYEGLYKCVAVKGEECIQIVIPKPPRNISILGISKDSIVYGIVDKQMTLTCDVESGKPPELMQWMNRNAVVATGGPASLTYTFIPNVSNHLQSLRCIAFNNVTRITLTKRVTLHLYFKPTVKTIPGGNINIIENEALLLDCNYTSNDNWNTSVIWKYTTNGHITYTANKQLKLDNIKRTDAGQYTCFVSNSAGEAEDSVIVNVLYPPRTPTNIKAFAQSDIIFVKWKADQDFGLQKTIFVEYRKHFEHRWNQAYVVNRSTITINGLDPDTIYLLRLYSTTAAGESNKTDETIVKTEQQHSKDQVFPAEFTLTLGAVLIMILLCWCSVNVLKNRQGFCRHDSRSSPSTGNGETATRQAYYDDIDSVNFYPVNVANSPEDALNNVLVISQRSNSNGNFENCDTNNSACQYITQSSNHQLKFSQEDSTPKSLTGESYIVPSMNFTDVALHIYTENEKHNLDTEELEIQVDESSIASDSSDTHVKIIGKYETLQIPDENEQSYSYTTNNDYSQ